MIELIMLLEKRKFKINLKNINFVLHNPSIIKPIIKGKNKDEIRDVKKRLIELQVERGYIQESKKFISSLKKTSSYHSGINYQLKLNRLCYIEDWDNKEFQNIFKELQNPTFDTYINRKEWIPTKQKIPAIRKTWFNSQKRLGMDSWNHSNEKIKQIK